MDTLENLRSQSEGAKDLKAVVTAMKAMAASNIVQYETAVSALAGYYHTVALGITGYFKAEGVEAISGNKTAEAIKEKKICAIVFGSDQGLVAQFNDAMAGFVIHSLSAIPGKKTVWVVGERVELLLSDAGMPAAKLCPVPNNVNAITALVAEILKRSQESYEKAEMNEFYIFHNKPNPGSGYTQHMQRFLPLDEKWKDQLQNVKYPGHVLPQVAGNRSDTLLELISGYLFVSLFKACAESLASENASRLEAMQRAEKNIGDLLDDLNRKYQRLRQSSIDEELFDVVSGFEALKIGQPGNSRS